MNILLIIFGFIIIVAKINEINSNVNINKTYLEEFNNLIENINNNYDIQYKLSWGKNKYELNNEVKEINFYRLGWDKTNVAIDSSNLTLTKEEFESIYNDYKLAMQNSN